MDFEGHGSFMGSQVENIYDKNLQGTTPTQYGNLTNTITSQWDGTNWTTYMGTRLRYYPNTTGVYLVGLPAYQNTFSCNGSCLWVGNYLVAQVIYLYDNPANANYAQSPSIGKLTTKRTMTRWTDPIGFTNPMYSDEVYTYDTWGNQNSITRYTGEGTSTALASTGAETTTTCYRGTVDPPSYNAQCPSDGYNTYQAWQRDPAGNIIQWAYDPIQGLPKKEIDPNGISNQTGYVTSATYDGFGRLLTIRRPGDEDTNYKPTIGIAYFDSYPGSSNAPFMINIEAKINNGPTYDAYENIRKFYNGLGQLIQQQTAHINLNGDTAFSQDVIVDYQYDAYGRVVKQDAPWSTPKWYNGMPNRPTPYYPNSPFANATLTTYDILGRATSVTAPDSTVTTTAYSIDPTNGPGLKIDQKDARNNHTDTIQDAWGRTIQVIPPTGPGTTYAYYVTGNLWTVTRAGNTTTMTYDLASRKLTMIDPDMGSWSYAYDALGNLVRQKDAKLQNTCLYYDGDNRLTGKVYQPGDTCPTSPILAVTYAYDQGTNGKGHRTSMTDSSGSTTWTYDARGRITQEAKVISGAGTFNTAWTYDSADLQTTIQYPADNNGNLGEIVTTNYTNDNNLINTLTPLQKGRFAQFNLRKWDKVANNDIKLPSKGHGNTENTTQVGRKPTHFLKTEYLQWSLYIGFQ